MALGIGLCLSLILNLSLVAGRGKNVASAKSASPSTSGVELEEETVLAGASNELVALIPIRGMISSSVSGRMGNNMVDEIKAQLRQAEQDSRVKAVVLAIDSPGGEVTASDIIYNAVCRVRAKKPVVISMGSLAASGGYYIACGGSYLFASDTTFTGSIGVIIQSYKYADLLGKLGVEPLTFKSGAFKDMLSGSREMTQAEKDYVQRLVMQTYGKFVGIVAKERKLPEEELRNGVADGRIVSGRDALDAKLVDAIGEIEAAYQKARELGRSPNATVISYQEHFNLSRLFRAFGADASFHGLSSNARALEVKFPQPLVPALEPGRAYFLPSLYVP
jgi:protease-4